MTHQPFDPIILDQMHEHPERFRHMHADEYIKLLIEDIHHYRLRLAAVEKLCDERVKDFRERFGSDPVAAVLVDTEDIPVMVYKVRAAVQGIHEHEWIWTDMTGEYVCRCGAHREAGL